MKGKLTSDWRLNYERPVTNVGGFEFELQSADVKLPTWHEPYRDGAYRVVKNGKRVGKIFVGETAWMDAARLFDDEVVGARFARWPASTPGTPTRPTW